MSKDPMSADATGGRAPTREIVEALRTFLWQNAGDDRHAHDLLNRLASALRTAEQERDILWIAVDHYAEAQEDDEGAMAKDALTKLRAARSPHSVPPIDHGGDNPYGLQREGPE